MKRTKATIPVFILVIFLSTLVFGCSRQSVPTASPSPSPLTSSSPTPSPSSAPTLTASPTASSTMSPTPSPEPSFQSQLMESQEDTTLTDSEKISRIIQLFFEAKAANFIDDGTGVDLSVFVSNNDQFSRNKIINFANLSREGRKLAGLEITSDNLKLMIYDIALNENTATVSLGEVYTYQIEGLQDPSAQRFGYNVYMSKDNGSWLITKIVTDNEAYTNELGSDSYNVDSALQEALASIKASSGEDTVLDKTPAKADSGSSAETYFYPLNRTDAAAYAFKYALDYNKAQFISWAPYGGDCADFASQCVWYGMGGRETSPSADENTMLPLWNMASDGNPHTGSFISISAFFAMINTDYSSATPHLSGNCYTQGSIAYAEPGDIIQIYNGSKWFHSYVVYSVSGQAGARTPADIQICAHNSDIQNVNFYTQWALGHPNAYRLIQINGAYY